MYTFKNLNIIVIIVVYYIYNIIYYYYKYNICFLSDDKYKSILHKISKNRFNDLFIKQLKAVARVTANLLGMEYNKRRLLYKEKGCKTSDKEDS